MHGEQPSEAGGGGGGGGTGEGWLTLGFALSSDFLGLIVSPLYQPLLATDPRQEQNA